MAFLNALGLTWEDRSSLLLMRNKDPRQGPPFLSHLTYSDYLRYGYISEQEMNAFHVFSVVRNPFKRIESFYRFLGFDCAISFEYFVRRIVPAHINPEHPCYYFFRPQVEFLSDSNGNIAVSNCLKLEDKGKLTEHLKTLGIYQLPHVNRSINRGRIRRGFVRFKYGIRGVYDPQFIYGEKIQWTTALVDMITQIYAADFSAFDYDLLPEEGAEGTTLYSIEQEHGPCRTNNNASDKRGLNSAF